MKVEARGLIFDASKKPDAERIAFFTSLSLLRSGTILAGCQVGPGKHAPTASIRLCRSRDGGTTWQELPFRFETTLNGVPGSLGVGEVVETTPGRLLLFTTWCDRSDPAKPVYDPASGGILHCRQLLAVSTDEGDTWGPWQAVPTPGLTGCATTGPAVSWADGTFAHAFESFKEYDDPKPGRHAAWLMVSRDGGGSFEPPFRVAQHPQHRLYYWDQRLCATKTLGEFIGLFWTHDLEAKRDVNVHFLRASINKPVTELPRETSMRGQIAAPLLLEDGRILAFVVDRAGPCTMKLWQSRDGGATWPAADCLTVHAHEEKAKLSQGNENIDFDQYWEDMGKWTFGHPAIQPLGRNHVLVAHYAGTPERLSIHWARVKVTG